MSTLPYQRQPLGPEYEQLAAELSMEEIETICDIVKVNHTRCTKEGAMRIAMAELPLCSWSDIGEVLDKCYSSIDRPDASGLVEPTLSHHTSFLAPQARKALVPEPAMISHLVTEKLPPISALTNPEKGMSEDPDDPLSQQNSKWTVDEEDRLNEYLHRTQGRKNWVHCARRVRTKSSAQCKSKFNNMRAQKASRMRFEL